MCVLALAFWATHKTLWRQEERYTGRTTGLGYQVLSCAW
jgi:hypothetical protein